MSGGLLPLPSFDGEEATDATDATKATEVEQTEASLALLLFRVVQLNLTVTR